MSIEDYPRGLILNLLSFHAGALTASEYSNKQLEF